MGARLGCATILALHVVNFGVALAGGLALHLTPLGPALLDAAEAFAHLTAPWVNALIY